MHLFHHVKFNPIDPLDDGLREEIAREQLEPQAITLQEDLSEQELEQYVQLIESDIEKDPEWFKFSDE